MGRIFTLFTIFLITTVLAMAQPSAQDKNIVVSPVSGSSSSLRIDFTNGTGGVGHIVIVKNSTGSYTPSNGSPSPSANTAFPGDNTANDLDAAVGGIVACVLNGTATNVTVTNLAADTEYTIQIYEYSGSSASPTYSFDIGPNNPVKIRYYGTAGSNSYSVPTGVTKVVVQAWGGGGGGGGVNASGSVTRGAGGGGGGTYTKGSSTVGGASVSFTVGSAGTAGDNGHDGGTGGTSSFPTASPQVSAVGGSGGQYAYGGGTPRPFGSGGGSTAGTTTNGGAGGTASGTGPISGGGGGAGGSIANGTDATGDTAGAGGNNGAGNGTAGLNNTSGNGSAGNFPGGGGSGGLDKATNTDRNGGAGGVGMVILSWYLPNSFTTGSVTTLGAPVIAGVWNSLNTSLDVVVPVEKNADLSGGGKIQLYVDDGSTGYTTLGSVYNIQPADLGSSVTINILKATLVTDAGTRYAQGKTLSFKARITDKNGNFRDGAASGTTLTIDINGPAAFTTGSVITTGGTVVAGNWNGTNTGVNIQVPVDLANTDASVVGGSIQLQARKSGGSFANIGTAYTPIVGGDRGTSKTLSLAASDITSISGYAQGVTLEFTAIVTDGNGNPTTGSQSATTLAVDTQAPTFTSLSPAASTHIGSTAVSYTLSEAISSGTITYNLTAGTDANAPHTYTMTAGDRTSGAHSITPVLTQPLIDGNTYQIDFLGSDAAGNQSALTSITGLIFDTTAPANFTVGSVITTGGNVVAGKWNGSNTGVDIQVPVDLANTDPTLVGGSIQLQARKSGGSFANIGTAYLPILNGDRGGNKTISLVTTDITSISGYAQGVTLEFTAIITDQAGNPKLGTQSATTPFVDTQKPTVNSHSIGSIGTNGFTYTLNVDEISTAYYEVTTSSTPPSVAQIKAGTGTGHVSNGNFAIGTANSNINQPIAGLNPLTQYYVYSFSEDAAGNQSTPIVSDNATTNCAPPTVQATAAGSPFTAVKAKAMTVNWVRGDGTGGVIVIARQTSAVSFTPSSGNNYSGQINSNFALATDQGSGNKVVYRGSGTSVTVTGLLPSTTYNYAVYEWNTANDCYLTSSPLVQSQATTAVAAEATIGGGAGVATISSLVVSQPAEVSSFSFTVSDAGTDASNTLISQMTFKPGTGNFFGNFTQLIAGAELYDNNGNGPAGVVTINSGTIQVASIPTGAGLLGEVLDGATKTYTLKLWLNGPLNAAIRATADGNSLVLSLTDTDVVTVAGSGNMASSNTNSGSANNKISVVATELRFVQQPTAVLIGNAMSPSVTVEATDQYGSRQLSFTSTVGITSTGVLSVSPTNAVFAAGLGTYSIVHTSTGAARTLTTNSGTLSNPTSSTFNITASNTSDIAANGAFAYPQNIAYDTFQESIDITNSGSSVVVAKFDIRDGGATLTDADGAGTALSQLALDLGSNYTMFRRIALYDATGTVEIPGTEQVVASQVVTFTGLGTSLIAPDNNFASFTVRVSFKTTVTDNAQFAFTVTSPTFAVPNTSSAFATGGAGNAGGAVTSTAGNNNRIEVVAIKFLFVQQPTNTYVGAVMTPSPTVQAIDALNNQDQDFTGNVPVQSIGSMVPPTANATFVAGLGTYPGLIHNAAAANIWLYTNHPTLTNVGSMIFEVIAKSSDIVANSFFIYPSSIPYNIYQENVNITNSGTSLVVGEFDIRDGGGIADGDIEPTVLNSLSLDLGPNYTFIRRIALYDASGTIEIPGTEQIVSSQIVNFGGLNITAPDNGTTSFTVRVSFTNSVVDNQYVSFAVSNATAQNGTSLFSSANAGGAITSTAGTNNMVEVTASKLNFVQQPVNTFLRVNMTPAVTIEATDNLNVRDLDFAGTINVTSSGSMSPVTQSAVFASGLGSYPTIFHTVTGSGLTLTTNNTFALADAVSNPFNINASNTSDIILTPAFLYPQNILYQNFQEAVDLTSASGTSTLIASFDIRDGGGVADADGAPTTYTSLTLDLGPNWQFIRRVAVNNTGGAELGGSDTPVTGQFVTMGGSFPVGDNSTFTITIRASFTTNVVDNQQFQVKISGATTAAGTSSTYAAPDAGGATAPTTGDNNRIEVAATKLVYTTNLNSPLLAAVNIGTQQAVPVLKALDGFNNLDLDYATPVSLSALIGFAPTTLNSDNAAPNAGVYTFPAGFQYSQTGNGTLTANSGILTGIASNPVTVQAGVATAIAAGASAPATISSLVNTSGAAVAAFNFDVVDDKTPVAPTNNDGLPTLINQITITANATFNTITDWTQALAGAILTDGNGHSQNATTITANSITFSGMPVAVNTLGYVPDDGTQNYTLKIYLKTALGGTLPSSIDGLQFQFEVLSSNIVISSNSTGVIGAQAVNSGNKDVITVVATQLKFNYPTGATSASLNTAFPGITLEATDANFNRDIGFTGVNATITALSNTSGQTMQNGPTVGTSQFSNGVYTFPATFKYTTGVNGDDVTLSLKAGTGTTCGTNALCISPSTTPASPTITLLSSFESAIVGDPTYIIQPTLDYVNHQENTNITTSSTSLEIGRALLVDGSRTNYSYGSAILTTGTDMDGLPSQDQDGASTVLNSLTIRITNPSNIRRIALYNGGTEIPGTEQAVTSPAGTPYVDIVFTGAPLLTAADDSQQDISVRVSFRGTAPEVTDHDMIQVSVIAASLGVGSGFYNGGPGYIAGVNGGIATPPTMNHIDVVATKLDFTTQPSAYAGISPEPVNAGIIHANDQLGLLDLDYNQPLLLSTPTAATSGSFTFINGVANLSSMLYTSAGDGTITATSGSLASNTNNTVNGLPNVSVQCSHVDVIHVSTVIATGGVITTTNLAGNSTNKVIFGFTFNTPYTVGSEPKLKTFTISFSNNVTGVLNNLRIYESATSTSYNVATVQDVELSPIGATKTVGSNSVTIDFTAASGGLRNLNNPLLTYFLMVDVDPTASASTPSVTPSVIDAGFGSLTNNNITITPVGASSMSNTVGQTYTFASIFPPILTASNPAQGQLNVNPNQSTIDLYFTVPVWSLDQKIELYDQTAGTGPFVCPLAGTPGSNGSPAGTTSALANPLKFTVPIALIPDHVYYVLVAPGVNNSSSGIFKGVMDEGLNLYPGITDPGTLYFKAASPYPPKLLSSPIAANPTISSISLSGAIINATFDQRGTAYFLVLTSGSAKPTIAQMNGSSAYAGSIAQGKINITQTVPISQSGIIAPATNLVNGQSYDVWMYAENDALPTPFATADAYGSSTYGYAVIGGAVVGPTMTFTATPGSSSVSLNNPTVTLCNNSYQVLNTPIIISEGQTSQFSAGGVQTLNLVLPAGFQFDVTLSGTVPKYGTITLQGADFTAGSGSLGFLGTSILTISYKNSGSSSLDKIILTGLRVKSTTATNGAIFRLGGNALTAAIPDISILATLSSFDAPAIAFNNSYSGSVFPVITSIPDNYTNAITLTPTTVTGGALYGPTIPPTQIPDYGPSSFSGPGVNGNVFTTSAVTLDAPFNITITHTDDNGCISANAIQYTVYDHNTAINITDSGGTPITSREYCADNDKFVTAPITVVIPPINSPTYGRAGHVRYVKHDNLSSFWLKNLTADLPVGAPPQLMSGTDWSNVVKTLPNLFSTSTNGAGTFPNYNFDDAVIANASAVSGGNLPDPYSYFENVIVSTDGTNRKFRYYKGGSLGSVAFTGTFQSRTNSAVIVPRVQLVDFYLPAVPIIDVSVPSTIDNADPLTLVGAANNPNNPINIGTPVYCEAGGAINIAGYPAADGVNSTGTWVLEDPATNTVIPSPPGFTAFTNGTATLDPKAFINGLKALPTPPAYLYGDIRIRYNYQETNAVCPATTTRIIRITPNPVGGFVQNAVISQFTPNNTSYCAGKQINFDATNTTLANAPAGTPANSITAYDWDFGDPNSSTNKVSGKLQNHTFGNPQSYIVTLNATSNWGCKSSDVAVTNTTLVVGSVPTVKLYFDGVYKQSNFTFYSNNSTVSANDFFKQIDINYGDGSTPGSKTYAADTQPTDPKTQFTHQYSSKGKYAVNLTVTSQIGCVNSLTLDNKYIKGYSDLDNKRARTLLVLDRVPVSTSATGYLQEFETGDGNWQAWYASNATYPLTFPIDPYTKSITWASGKATGPVIKPDPSGLNGTNYWRTGYDSVNNVVGTYGNNERSALYSPSFDLSALYTPMIQYDNVIQLEASDGIILEYSTDNLNVADPNKVWKVLGSAIGEGVYWFTDKGIAAKPGAQSGNDFGWTGSASAQWNRSKHTLDEVATSVGGRVNATNVVFRFAMASAKSNPQFEGFAVDNVRIGERTRTILLESFASTSNSSANEKSENQTIANFYPLGTSTGTQVVKINYHMNFPKDDPFNKDNPADPSSRALFYGIQSTPRSVLDGSPDKDDRPFSVWSNSTYGVRSLELAQADIQILDTPTGNPDSVKVSAGKISFYVKVTPIFALPSTSVLQVAILEKSVAKSALTSDQQAMILSGETDFQYILKKMLPSAKGIRFDTAWAATRPGRFFPGGGQAYEYYVDANKLYQPGKDLMVVAFLQDEAAREVFQVHYTSVTKDPPVVTGLEPLPAEQIIVYPVPANHEMHIRMPGVLKQPAALQMFDQTGRITIESQIPEGADSKTLNVRDLSSGVYILQIDVGNGNFTRKKVMIVHEE